MLPLKLHTARTRRANDPAYAARMERVENASVIGSIQSIGGSIASPKRRGSKNFTAPVADLPELDRAKKDAVGKKPKTSKLSPSSGKNRRRSSFKKVVDKAKKKAGVKKPKEQPMGGNGILAPTKNERFRYLLLPN